MSHEVEGPPLPHDQANDDAHTVLAVDVARYGSDKSVLLLASPSTVLRIESYQNLDTMQLAGRVAHAYKHWSPNLLSPKPSPLPESPSPLPQKPNDLPRRPNDLSRRPQDLTRRPQDLTRRIIVDEVGVGAGVVDRLKELGLPVTGINVGRPARKRSQFINLRAEGYWRLRDLLAQGLISFPDDPELAGQLASIRHFYRSSGQLYIESKDDSKARGIPSPDKADALMLAYLDHHPSVRLHI